MSVLVSGSAWGEPSLEKGCENKVTQTWDQHRAIGRGAVSDPRPVQGMAELVTEVRT